jgi:hypothetical protein
VVVELKETTLHFLPGKEKSRSGYPAAAMKTKLILGS